MSLSCSEGKCSQCSSVVTSEFNGRTCEKVIQCQVCGRRIEVKSVRKNCTDAKQAKADGWDVIHNDNEEFALVKRKYSGYGVLCVATKQGGSATYPFSQPPSEEIIAQILRDFEDPLINKRRSYITEWDENQNCLKLLFGKVPTQFTTPQTEENIVICKGAGALMIDTESGYLLWAEAGTMWDCWCKENGFMNVEALQEKLGITPYIKQVPQCSECPQYDQCCDCLDDDEEPDNTDCVAVDADATESAIMNALSSLCAVERDEILKKKI